MFFRRKKLKAWDVYYWRRDALGCEQIIAKVEFKAEKSSDYIEAQGLTQLEKFKAYRLGGVKYGFVLKNDN